MEKQSALKRFKNAVNTYWKPTSSKEEWEKRLKGYTETYKEVKKDPSVTPAQRRAVILEARKRAGYPEE